MSKTQNAPKKPQDHLEKEIPLSQIEGHELLVPLEELDVEAGLELLDVLHKVTGNATSEEEIREGFSIGEIAKMIRVVRTGGFVADEEGFKKFATARNTEKTVRLITSYVGELGKEFS